VQILYIELHPSSETKVELRYHKLKSQGYGKQVLQISEIAGLIDLAERDIYVSMPDPVAMGKKLFGWLDGDRRWLSRALADCDKGLFVAVKHCRPSCSFSSCGNSICIITFSNSTISSIRSVWILIWGLIAQPLFYFSMSLN
jgi:hypothetical protein